MPSPHPICPMAHHHSPEERQHTWVPGSAKKGPLCVCVPQISAGVDGILVGTWVGHSITPPLYVKIERKKSARLFLGAPHPPVRPKVGVRPCCSMPNFECPGDGGGGFYFALPGLKSGHHAWRHVHSVTTVDAPRCGLQRTHVRQGSSTHCTTPAQSVALHAMAPHLTGHELDRVISSGCLWEASVVCM